ncbi:conserved Plasmodium protein, unknown function [Plasmodium malariae]|uniref:Uncharacterized protein n=2 Tax=Plasmodium (Plasmodium) TaxID=418103 RepID=A0A1D3TF52_PLAMA|nr:conserved Plasmodium protein, unknown function [Plasmodium malariae]SCP03580.1 conserved Plasmodium protein, unknown function [Plasmodium malariae]
MNVLYNSYVQSAYLIAEMNILNSSCKEKWNMMDLIKSVKNEQTYGISRLHKFSWLNLFFLFIPFTLVYNHVIKLVLCVVILLYIKYILNNFFLFLYKNNIQRFNELIKLLYIQAYTENNQQDKEKLEFLIDDLYCRIHKMAESILKFYFFFMQNLFFYFMVSNDIIISTNQYSTTYKSIKKLFHLKKFYFHLFVVLMEIELKRDVSEEDEEEEEKKKKKKKSLYKNIRNVFKSKYLKEYELMRENETNFCLFSLHQCFKSYGIITILMMIRRLFCFLHLFLFTIISVYYLIKTYLVLSSYINVIKKKKKKLLPLRGVSQKDYSKYSSRDEETIISFVIDSLILLHDCVHDGMDCQYVYETVEHKLRSSLSILKSLRREIAERGVAKGMQAKGVDAKGVDANGVDAKGVDANRVDEKGVDAKGVDANGGDANGVDANRVAEKTFNVSTSGGGKKNDANEQSNENIISTPITCGKDVHIMGDQLIETASSIRNNEKRKISTYEVYYYSHKEVQSNIQDDNYEELHNAKRNKYASGKYSNRIAAANNPLFFQDKGNNEKKLMYKDEKYVSLHNNEKDSDLCIYNLLSELKDTFKNDKKYIYVNRELCYDNKKKDFTIKSVLYNQTNTLTCSQTLTSGGYAGCTKWASSCQQKDIVKYDNVNTQIQQGIKNIGTLHNRIISNNINQDKDKNKNEETSNWDCLKPMDDISSFRQRIAASLFRSKAPPA